MNREEIKNAIPAYCLGMLDQEEQRAVEVYLQNDDAEIRQLVDEMRLVVEALPQAVTPVEPSADLKQKIMSAVQLEPKTAETPAQSPPRVVQPQESFLAKASSSWNRLSWGLAFALLMAAIGLGVYTNNLSDRIAALDEQLAGERKGVQTLEQELTELRRLKDFINSPDILVVKLGGSDEAPASSANVFWDPEKQRAVFHAFDLPQPPSEKDYQLWMIRGGKPIDAGIFTVNQNGFGEAALDAVAKAGLGAFAVTLEPKGGVPQPTGKMYLVGQVEI